MSAAGERPLGVGILGFGFMGQTHARAYARLGRERAAVVAILDAGIGPGGLAPAASGNLGGGDDGTPPYDPREVVATDDMLAFFNAPGLDAVSICLPTDLHTRFARHAMEEHGLNVLVEKPVSLDPAEVRSLIELERATGRVCMPAMCMRFWPAWAHIARVVRGGELGGVRAAAFERIGAMPAWGGSFYESLPRSGGALFDLHIHDTDFVCALFGEPSGVTTVGSMSHATTLYHYEGPGLPAQVTARGGWLAGPVGFRMRAVVEFEGGTLDFDLARRPELLLARPGAAEPEPVPLADETGYDGEVRAFVDAVRGRVRPPVTLEDAALTLDVLHAERASLEGGGHRAVARFGA